MKLTGGIDTKALASWALVACERGETHAEIHVDPHGWFLRAPGQNDFLMEPDAAYYLYGQGRESSPWAQRDELVKVLAAVLERDEPGDRAVARAVLGRIKG